MACPKKDNEVDNMQSISKHHKGREQIGEQYG